MLALLLVLYPVASLPALAGEGPPCDAQESHQASPQTAAHSDDGRRTLRRFPLNLSRNAVGVFSRENAEPFLLGAAGTGAGAFLDAETQSFFTRHPAKTLGDVGDSAGARYLTGITAGLFIAGRVSHNARFRAATYDLTQAAVVDAAYVFAIKKAVRRERPDGSNRLSFPSGHTANAVTLATVAHRHFGPKVGIPGYVLAGLVGVSRLARQAHHLSDVLAGATLGYIGGRTAVKRDSEADPQRQVDAPHEIRLSPSAGPQGDGMGLQVSIRF